MTNAETNSVHKLKRSFLWFVLVAAVAGFASWSEQMRDDKRAQEIRTNQGSESQKRIAGTQPPTSAALLLQLRFASAMLEPRRPQQRRGFSPFDDDSTDPSRRDDSRDDQSSSSSNSRINGLSNQRNSRTPFSSQTSTSPYSTSPSSGFGQNSTYGQPYGQSSTFGQSNTFGQSSSSRTNTRNQNDAQSGLLGSDNPN